ncbi:protein translocase subunit SecA-like [Sinocyclocheilus grahami]|uniref:protein translocase subunit SecA-like n=1 Tax=Sinocyclocheilus grahami TaxID=75366 RepID=UPI0007ACA7F7|nr:PREDICTED: protein translocase subunit SecA-like [Sinocyclocheilus grahami]
MEASGKLLSSRLLSLLKNRQWERDDVVKLFKALVKEFNGKNEDFHTWMMKIIHQVEIHKIQVSDLTFQNDSKIVDHIEAKINEIATNTNEKTLDEIVEEIRRQGNIDERIVACVKNTVSSVSTCLSASSAPHLQGIKQSLFKLCKAVEKTKKYKPRLTQMVSWCILALSESSRLVQVLTGEGKSCIVAMFAAYQVTMGKTPDIISSSPVLAERDAKEWSAFYKRLNITVDVNTNKSKDNELRKCYECQVVYGTTDSFAGDFLRQRFHRKDVRPKREFQCVIVDEVDSLMLDKGLEVVYLSTEVPLMESLNGMLANIWFVVNQLKCLDTGEMLGPIQLFSQVLSEIITENKNIDQLSIVQNAVDETKQLDNASVGQTEAFLNMFVRTFPEYLFQLYQEGPDGNLQKLNEISPTGTYMKQEISVLLLGNGKCRLVYYEKDSLVKSLGKMIKECLQSESKEHNESRIPGLQDLINEKVQTWIENALLATKMTLGNEYVLHGDGVSPVDYESTGVVQNNMKWGEGLQQFLEMKHQTKLSNMSLITNFMSNVGLFKRYSNKIFGITGTLGDQTELDMLKKLYSGIDTCKIPSFRRRKLYELGGMVIKDVKDWIKMVCIVVQDQVSSTIYRGPRAALVICETIKRAEIFYRGLANTIPLDKLKLYVNNNIDNAKITDSTVQAGDVIIATNLAGRGTDLKVCESVNEAGGLFVMQTFLPLNVRVEDQAFGRTARQGSPGSAQIIMCASHFSDLTQQVLNINTPLTSLLILQCCLITQVLHWIIQMLPWVTEYQFEENVNRYLGNHSSETHEEMISALTCLLTMNSFPFQGRNLEKAKEARNTAVNTRLSRFLEKNIPEIIKKEEFFSVYLDVLDNVYEDVLSDQRDVIVPCLHECWGLWLLIHFSEEKTIEMLKEQLKVDLSSAKGTLLSKQSPSSMVYYYIRSGNNFREKGHFTESIEMYTRALEDGASGEIIPLYNRALATIRKKDTGYIAQALADLEKADKAIVSCKSHLAQILTYIKLSSQEPRAEGSTLLTTQFQMKSMVVDLLQMNIQDAVMKLKRAESRGGNVSLTEKLTFFLAEHFVFIPPRLLKELLMELMHVKSLGLDTIFSLDTMFSFSGFVSKILKRWAVP